MHGCVPLRCISLVKPPGVSYFPRRPCVRVCLCVCLHQWPFNVAPLLEHLFFVRKKQTGPTDSLTDTGRQTERQTATDIIWPAASLCRQTYVAWSHKTKDRQMRLWCSFLLLCDIICQSGFLFLRQGTDCKTCKKINKNKIKKIHTYRVYMYIYIICVCIFCKILMIYIYIYVFIYKYIFLLFI